MYDSYRIESGDTISSVASKFGISIDELFNINNWSFLDLEEGKIINIPYNKDNYLDNYTVVEGDTLYDISKRFNIRSDDLALLNGLEIDEYIYPGDILKVPREGISLYITKDGDDIETVLKTTNNIDEFIKTCKNIKLLPDQMIIYRKN